MGRVAESPWPIGEQDAQIITLANNRMMNTKRHRCQPQNKQTQNINFKLINDLHQQTNTWPYEELNA